MSKHMAEMETLGGRAEIVICRDGGRKRWIFRPVEEIVGDLNEVLQAELAPALFDPFACVGCGIGMRTPPPHAWPRDRRGGWQHIAVYVTEQRGGDQAWHVHVAVAAWRGSKVVTEKVCKGKVFDDLDLAWRIARRTAELLGAV